MYCTNCGKKITEDSKYCNHCGHESPSTTPSEIKHNKPKNRKFPQKIFPFLIIFGIILFIAYAFFNSKGYIPAGGIIPAGNNKASLEQRYTKLESLLNEKNCTEEMYNYFSTNEKSSYSMEDCIKSATSSKVVKRIAQINSITIRGNIGYIDRNITKCLSADCSNKKETRDYDKWVFENGNWYETLDNVTCIRETPYEKPAEFDRALSLVKQRLTDRMGEKTVGDFSFFNCLDIQYSSLNDAEGLFTFDEKNSNLGKLTIYVDNSYKIKDDILTAFLITHEVFHASQYLNRLNSGSVLDCYAEEIQAFWWQSQFLASLNKSEIDSVTTRIVSTDYSSNNPLVLMKTFADFSGRAIQACGSNENCKAQKFTDQITAMVKSNPYYQKQCLAK